MSLLLLLAAGVAACRVPAGGTPLPIDYLAHRLVLRVPQPVGPPLRFYLDTGGGTNMLYSGAVARLGLTVDSVAGGSKGSGTVPAAKVSMPAAYPSFSPESAATLFVPPSNPEFENETDGPLDGFLSRVWFADRGWTLDYPARSLRYHPAGLGDSLPAECWVPLGFQADSTGRRTTHFPRMTAVVDGDTLQFLFDTGAMTSLSDSALARIGDGGPSRRGTSFITASVVSRWRTRHPDWRVIERAELGTNAAMIEVPAVTIGGTTVGPVWFTSRPDPNFHQYMAQWMDRPLDGALGGSAFRYFVIVLDYPKSRAAFIR
jgi:hypothetical protein